jgi:hypothetical protein
MAVRSIARTWILATGVLLISCGQVDRSNPNDPLVGPVGGRGIELIVSLPLDNPAAIDRLVAIRYKVSGPDIAEDIMGSMSLVGDRATALVRGVAIGPDRVFRVDALDVNGVRTFSAVDTLDVEEDTPEEVLLVLQRLTGSIELTSKFPGEVTELDVSIVADGDTFKLTFDVEIILAERIVGVPTGTDVLLILSGRDEDDQVLVQQVAFADVRVDLVARVVLPVQTGSIQIVANFPGFIPIVSVDRFSDEAGTFFRRSDQPDLPEAGEAIDFDEDFLLIGFGPNGERVDFYQFDVRSQEPAAVYVLVDLPGDVIAGQLPIFDELPGEPGYNDLRRVIEVRVTDPGYRPNSIQSFEDIQAATLVTTPADEVWNCVVAPEGSTATKRFAPADPIALQSAWYRGQIVRYLLFENPNSTATVNFPGDVTSNIMYAFLANNLDVTGGFATEPQSGATHNVVTRLPQQDGYSPLWTLQAIKLLSPSAGSPTWPARLRNLPAI